MTGIGTKLKGLASDLGTLGRRYENSQNLTNNIRAGKTKIVPFTPEVQNKATYKFTPKAPTPVVPQNGSPAISAWKQQARPKGFGIKKASTESPNYFARFIGQ